MNRPVLGRFPQPHLGSAELLVVRALAQLIGEAADLLVLLPVTGRAREHLRRFIRAHRKPGKLPHASSQLLGAVSRQILKLQSPALQLGEL